MHLLERISPLLNPVAPEPSESHVVVAKPDQIQQMSHFEWLAAVELMVL